MTLAVDPALSLADSSKLADEIKEHTHRRLAALEGLHVEVVQARGRDLSIIQRPNTNTSTEPPTSNILPAR